ncbi:phosphate ABC transporter substrate-binding protein [Pelagibacterium xiamenense]|uniref:phosphate ABC transporter substrate-binding protein n=1 Tax=Pelagibacterium xiamenense TaxID=2901140 RepID=UPI001E553F36|nr:phosphate ABC transporter substrate-binding protein [Pelagibacterium xiamenense]MCD7058627.1 phosphate ABC transporter substrate-binding protein [Pelagibacterium xiamenense]
MTEFHKTYPGQGPLTLSANITEFPPTRALLAGEVSSELVTLDFAGLDKAHDGFKDMLRRGRFDISEMAIATYLQAHAYGKPFTLLPFVVLGRFQHHCIGYNTDVHKQLAPGDLAGKTVGVRSYTQTTGLWVRGILQNEYGVNPDSVNWLCFDQPHLQEYTDPPSVSWGDPADDPVKMLLAGKLDAAILGMNMPKDERIKPLIPDPHETAKAWYAREGLVPPNHYLIVPNALCDQRPDVVEELCRMMAASRAKAKTEDGIDPWPVGINANRRALTCAAKFAAQQHMIDRQPEVDELFHPLIREIAP